MTNDAGYLYLHRFSSCSVFWTYSSLNETTCIFKYYLMSLFKKTTVDFRGILPFVSKYRNVMDFREILPLMSKRSDVS